MSFLRTLLLGISLTLILSECRSFLPKVPDYFPENAYQYNPALFRLGRQLFYDPILSTDSSTACASCHHSYKAFSDAPKKVSLGINSQLGTRNTLPLFNLRWYPYFFWDGGVQHPDFMALAALGNSQEMNQDLASAIQRLQQSPRYRQEFRKAFRADSITSQQVLWSLRHFLEGIVSFDSPYDRYLLGKIQLSEQALEGLEIFQKHCASCHPSPFFGRQSFANNGLDIPPFKDLGQGRITHQAEDEGRFLVPSLRNLAFTAPYMHDGRFENLEDVLNHYAQEVIPTQDLPRKIALNVRQKTALLTFLATLNDSSFIQRKQYQD